MPVRAWARLSPTTQYTNLEFLTLKWAVVEKFHEYLYGWTFDVYTNNPLTYVLTTAKLDACSYHWVASLVNYNLWLYYQVRKTNIDVDSLLRVSWPGCVPDNSRYSSQGHSCSSASCARGCPWRSCNSHWDLELQSPCSGCSPPVWLWETGIRSSKLVISRLRHETLGWWQSKSTDPPEFSLFLLEWNHLLLRQGLEENVLVATDHFTRYAQAYVTRTQTSQTCWIKAKNLRVSWWLTSVHWWECRKYRLACPIHRPTANMRGSTPLWLVCWECYP